MHWGQAFDGGAGGARAGFMIVLVVQVKIGNFDAWKKVFDEFPPKMGGAVFHRVNQMVSDPQTVAVAAGFKTASEAEAFMASPDLAAAMKKSGVVGAPRIEMYTEVEAVTY